MEASWNRGTPNHPFEWDFPLQANHLWSTPVYENYHEMTLGFTLLQGVKPAAFESSETTGVSENGALAPPKRPHMEVS